MTISKHLRLFPEGGHERGTSLHRAQVPASALGEIGEVRGAVVGHGVMLEVAPDAFDGVHFRSVGRQTLEHDAATLRLHMGAHELRAVGLQAVPDDQQLLADRPLQGLEKFDDLRARECAKFCVRGIA